MPVKITFRGKNLWAFSELFASDVVDQVDVSMVSVCQQLTNQLINFYIRFRAVLDVQVCGIKGLFTKWEVYEKLDSL